MDLPSSKQSAGFCKRVTQMVKVCSLLVSPNILPIELFSVAVAVAVAVAVTVTVAVATDDDDDDDDNNEEGERPTTIALSPLMFNDFMVVTVVELP